MPTKVKDLYDDPKEFEGLLNAGEEKARTDKETKFVDGLTNSYASWGQEMFLSDAQNEWLIDIATRG